MIKREYMRIKFLILLCGFQVVLLTQKVNAQQIIDTYIQVGISSNLDAQRLNKDMERSIWAIRESKRLYGPTVDFVASHKVNYKKPINLSEGGLASGLSGFLEQAQLGFIKDGNLYFPPRNQFADLLQVNQTIFNKTLDYQIDIRKVEKDLAENKISDFKIELETAIRSAYLTVLQSSEFITIYKENLEISNQQLAFTEKLLAENKITRDAKYRALASVEKAQANLNSAQTGFNSATSYFNFLLNKPLDSEIEIDPEMLLNIHSKYKLLYTEQNDVFTYKINNVEIQEKQGSLIEQQIRSQALPVVLFQAQGGIQGINYDFSNSRLPLFSAGITLKWNLFNNGTRSAEIQQSRLKNESLAIQKDYILKDFEQQRNTGIMKLENQLKNFQAVNAAKTNSEKYLDAVQKKYKEGLSSVIELYDAQEQKLQTSISEINWYYDLQQLVIDYNKIAINKLKLIK